MKRPLVVAHRGASAYAPENTMAAFKKAFEMGSDGIELDVQLTSDGKVVCIHDYTVNRTSNGNGTIGKMTLPELKKLDFGSWFSSQYKNERIPTLDEVLAFAEETYMMVNIEIKGNYNNIEEKTIKLIEKHNMLRRVIISSFNHNSLIKIKNLQPLLKIGLLFSAGKVAAPDYAKRLGAWAIHPWYGDMDERSIKPFKKDKIAVNVYTVDKVDHILEMSEIGVTSIITNVPDRAKKVLE